MVDNAKIKALRVFRGYTQEELSRKADVGLYTLHRIETGHTKDPGIINVTKIAQALQVKVDDLLIHTEKAN
jgi:transcriptional regulator with XRE-family HTH domain